MKYDKPLLAAFFGALSTIPGEVLTQGLTFLGIGQYSIYQLASLFMTLNRPSEITGSIIELFLGGFTGITFYYLLEKIGYDYLTLKSLFFGILSWLFAEVLFKTLIEGHLIDIRSVNDYYVHLIGAIAFGVTQGLLFKRYLFSNIIQKS